MSEIKKSPKRRKINSTNKAGGDVISMLFLVLQDKSCAYC